ncbi:MAG: hypothetical protein WBP33_02915 [Saprospiraceae bacterium]
MMKIKAVRKEKEKIVGLELEQNLSQKELIDFLIEFFTRFVINQPLTESEFLVLEKLMMYSLDDEDINSSVIVKRLMIDLNFSKQKTVYDLRSRLVDKFCLNKKNKIFSFPAVLDLNNYADFEINIKTQLEAI